MRILSLLSATILLASPAFAADIGVYRPGIPYGSAVAGSADVCDRQCSGDAQCRGWNYVKTNPRAPGVCEFLSSVSTPIPSKISISGEGFGSGLVSPSLTAGGTNTIRVGTPVQPTAPQTNLSKTASPRLANQGNRRVVRQAVPQRLPAQRASTRKIENQSLTAQQNRFRQAQHGVQPISRPQQIGPNAFGRRNFPHILDGSAPNPQNFSTNPGVVQQPAQQQRPVQQQYQRPQQRPVQQAVPGPQALQNQGGRRQTGPRNAYPAQQAPVQQQYSSVAPQQYSSVAPGRIDTRPAIGVQIPASQSMAKRSVVKASNEPIVQPTNPVALTREQAGQRLYGRLNDDIRTSRSSRSQTANGGQNTPPVGAAPTIPVESEPLEVLAGGL